MKQGLEIRRLGQSVAQLALPVLIEQFFIVIMGMVNTMLASNLGNETISAIGMVDTVSIIIISFFNALAIGGTVVVAQYTGHGDRHKADQAATQAIWSCLLIAGLITGLVFLGQKPLILILYRRAEAQVLENALQYLRIVLWSYIPIALVGTGFGILRGSGNTRTPMRVSILMNLFNVIFSYSLIYGLQFDLGFADLRVPAFGIRGAAFGLTLARAAGLVLILIPLIRGSRHVRLIGFRHFHFEMDIQKCIFQLGIPAGTEQLLFNGGKLIVQTFIVRLGTVALAANSIAASVAALMMIPGNALSTAAVTLVGQQIGQGNPREAKKQLSFLVIASTLAQLLISLLLLPFVIPLIQTYTRDLATVRMAATLILSSMIAQPLFWAMSFITPAGLRGAGDVRYTMKVSMISMWLLRILLGYVLTVWVPAGVLGIWLAMYIDWLARAVFFVRRLASGRWMRGTVFGKKAGPEFPPDQDRGAQP